MKEIIKEAFSILFAIISIYIFLVFILSLWGFIMLDFKYRERASKEALDTANYIISNLEVESARANHDGSISIKIKDFESEVYIHRDGELYNGYKEEFVKNFERIKKREKKILDLADKIEKLLDWDNEGKYIRLFLNERF